MCPKICVQTGAAHVLVKAAHQITTLGLRMGSSRDSSADNFISISDALLPNQLVLNHEMHMPSYTSYTWKDVAYELAAGKPVASS